MFTNYIFTYKTAHLYSIFFLDKSSIILILLKKIICTVDQEAGGTPYFYGMFY